MGRFAYGAGCVECPEHLVENLTRRILAVDGLRCTANPLGDNSQGYFNGNRHYYIAVEANGAKKTAINELQGELKKIGATVKLSSLRYKPVL